MSPLQVKAGHQKRAGQECHPTSVAGVPEVYISQLIIWRSPGWSSGKPTPCPNKQSVTALLIPVEVEEACVVQEEGAA